MSAALSAPEGNRLEGSSGKLEHWASRPEVEGIGHPGAPEERVGDTVPTEAGILMTCGLQQMGSADGGMAAVRRARTSSA